MALSDFFYPGNPERRENLIRKNQELFELMKNNFETTNKLTEMVNEHLHSSFSPITLSNKATFQENCEVMTERVKQIQEKVNEADEELKKKLDPALYGSLQHMTFQTLNNVSAAVKDAISSVCQLSAVLFITHVKKIVMILESIAISYTFYTLGIGAAIFFGLAIDAIASAILGSVERAKLEKALKEYDEVLEKIRPVSKDYQEAINEIWFLLKYMKK